MNITFNVWKDVSSYCQLEVEAPDRFFFIDSDGNPMISDEKEFAEWAKNIVKEENDKDHLFFEPEPDLESGLRIASVNLGENHHQVDLDLAINADFWFAGQSLQQMRHLLGDDERLKAMFTQACRLVGISEEEQNSMIRSMAWVLDQENEEKESDHQKQDSGFSPD